MYRTTMWRVPVLALVIILVTHNAQAQSSPETETTDALAAEIAADLGDIGETPDVEQPVRRAAIKNALLPDVSAVFTGLGKWFANTPTSRFPAHEPVASQGGLGVQLQELEIAQQAYADPYIRGDIYLALGLSGIEVEEAYLTTLALPGGMKARVGEFYTPFGRFNTQHYLEVSPFVDLPLPNRRMIGGEQLRGLGFEVSWLLPLPWYVEIISSLTTAQNEVSFGLPRNETGHIRDFLSVHHLRQFFELSDDWSLQLGGSAAQGPNVSGGAAAVKTNRTTLAGADLYLKWRAPSSIRSVALQSEYMLRKAIVPGGNLKQGGLYAQVDARLDRNWQVAVRVDALGLPATAFGNPNVLGELEPWLRPVQQERYGTAVSYYFSEFHRWRLQYNFDKLNGTPADLAALPRGNALHQTAAEANHELFLQVQFILGAHGAHVF